MFFTRSAAELQERPHGLKNEQLRGGQVVLYMMRQAAVLVKDVLLLAVALHRGKVLLPLLLLVTRMRRSPLLAARAHRFGVEGIGSDLLGVILAPAMALAGGLASNQLLGMIRGRQKDLLAAAATAITHQVAPDQNPIHHSVQKHC